MRLVLRVTLSRQQAERLAAKAISESRNRDDVVAETLEQGELASPKGKRTDPA